jgi:hypothetical protein
MAARPKTRRSTPKKSLSCGVAGCFHRPLTRKRAALLAPLQQTTSPYHLPAIGKKLADNANRDGGAERFAAPAGHKSLAVDLALLTYDEKRWHAVDRPLGNTAQPHDAQPLYLLHTVPGIGTSLRLVLLYDIHQRDRCPRGQAFAASCRLGTCAKASAGKRSGPSGTTIGKAHLTWARAEAAGVFLRDTPAGQKVLTRVEKKQGQGLALPLFAHKLARASYFLLQHTRAFDMAPCLHCEGRGVGELAASLASTGLPLPRDALQCPHPCVAARR